MSSVARIICGVCTQALGNCKYRQLNPCNHFFHLVCLRKVFFYPERFTAVPKKCPVCAGSSISRDDIALGLENSPLRKRVKLSDPIPRERHDRNRQDALGVLEELESDNEVEPEEPEELENEDDDVVGLDENVDQEMEVEVVDLEEENADDQPMDDIDMNEAGPQGQYNIVDPEEVSQDDVDFIEGLRGTNPRNINRYYLRVRIQRPDGDEGTFKCHFCEEAFIKRQTRRTHEEVAHFERVSCEICAARFKTNTNFVKHMRVVHERAEFRHPHHGGRRPV